MSAIELLASLGTDPAFKQALLNNDINAEELARLQSLGVQNETMWCVIAPPDPEPDDAPDRPEPEPDPKSAILN